MMSVINIQDEKLFQQIKALADRENRPIEAILRIMVEQYAARADALNAMDGIFNDDISDMSTSVKSTMTAFYKDRDERSD